MTHDFNISTLNFFLMILNPEHPPVCGWIRPGGPGFHRKEISLTLRKANGEFRPIYPDMGVFPGLRRYNSEYFF